MDALRQSPVVDASQPVLRGSPSAEELCDLLAQGVERLKPGEGNRVGRLRHNDAVRGIERLRGFLAGRGSAWIDERTMADFKASLLSSGADAAYANDLVRHVRRAVNGLPPEILNRLLLDDKAWQKANRFEGLAPGTASILKDFLLHGRKVHKGAVSVKALSPTYRENVVAASLAVLRKTAKSDLSDIVESDAELILQDYERREMRNSGLELLSRAGTLFRHMIAKGIAVKNPFAQYTQKIVTTDDDFVSQEGIDLLRDLSTLETKSFMDVRDRMIAFALLYDFGLRIGEAVRLNVADFALDDLVGLTLRPEVQKGTNKRRVLLHNYFRESKLLVSAYLKLRTTMKPADDAFLVADDGRRLGATGAASAVVSLCEKLGVHTHENDTPGTHRFRHSLGTLNIEPLGLSLSAWEVSERLRHESLKTTLDTYVARNPLIQRARHVARLQRNGTPSSHGSDHAHSTIDRDDFTVAESGALAVGRPFGITCKSLRLYCRQNGTAKVVGKSWLYSKAAMDDLAKNWMPRDRAMRMLKISKSGFYFWVGANAVPTMTIGRAALVQNEAVLQAIDRKSA